MFNESLFVPKFTLQIMERKNFGHAKTVFKKMKTSFLLQDSPTEQPRRKSSFFDLISFSHTF